MLTAVHIRLQEAQARGLRSRTTSTQLLRQAVRRRGGRVRPRVLRRACASGRQGSTSCGRRSADHGFLGVHLPEEYGGRRRGHRRARDRRRGGRRPGCPLLTTSCRPRSAAELIAALRRRSAEGAVAARARRGHEDGVRDHRARRGLEQPPHRDDGDPRRRRVARATARRPSSPGRRRGAAQCWSSCRTGTDEATRARRGSACSWSTPTRRGSRATLDPRRDRAARQAVHPVLRQRRGRRRPARRRRGRRAARRCSTASTPSGSWAPSLCNGVGRYVARASPRATRASGACGTTSRSARTRASPTRSPIAKIELELARLMTQRAAWLHDHAADRAAAGEAANMAKYAAAEAARALPRRGDPDPRWQRHGDRSTALADLWGIVRLLRIAPVSREMVLNFVAHRVARPPEELLTVARRPTPRRRGAGGRERARRRHRRRSSPSAASTGRRRRDRRGGRRSRRRDLPPLPQQATSCSWRYRTRRRRAARMEPAQCSRSRGLDPAARGRRARRRPREFALDRDGA